MMFSVAYLTANGEEKVSYIDKADEAYMDGDVLCIGQERICGGILKRICVDTEGMVPSVLTVREKDVR